MHWTLWSMPDYFTAWVPHASKSYWHYTELRVACVFTNVWISNMLMTRQSMYFAGRSTLIYFTYVCMYRASKCSRIYLNWKCSSVFQFLRRPWYQIRFFFSFFSNSSCEGMSVCTLVYRLIQLIQVGGLTFPLPPWSGSLLRNHVTCDHVTKVYRHIFALSVTTFRAFFSFFHGGCACAPGRQYKWVCAVYITAVYF